MPHVAVLTEEMNSPHGTQMLAAVFMDQAVRRGWRVTLYTAQYSPTRSVWKTFLAERNVSVVHPGFWAFTRYHLPHRAVAWRLARGFRKDIPTLVWSADNEPLTCRTLQFWPRNGPPFFVHDPSEASADCPHYPPLWFEVCRRASGLTVHGNRQAAAAKEYYQFGGPVEAVWPACFAPTRDVSLPRLDRPLRFGQLGRVYSLKGPWFAVAAMARLRALGHAAELHFHGDGPHLPLVRELAESLRLSDHVFFHGEYDSRELDAIVETLDVGIMPSVYEGFGLVMLEFMCRGRPVIATDVGSSREVIEKMGAGWVVRRADTEDLAQAMARVCSKPELVLDMGAVAQQVWARHFTPVKMFDRHLAFWRRCGVVI